MIITKESDIFQGLLHDVEYLKDVIKLGKYYVGCDPYDEDKPQPKYKTGDWVKRIVGKDDKAHAYGRVFKIIVSGGNEKDMSGVINDDEGFSHFRCSLRMATEEEIKEHLLREAVKRGLVGWRRFRWEGKGERDDITTIIPGYGYTYLKDIDVLTVGVKESTARRAIYRNGTWAIPVFDEEKLPCPPLELEQILRDFCRAICASDFLGEANNEIEKFMRKRGYK